MLWEGLPRAVHDAVADHAGPMSEVTPVSGGVNSDRGVVLDTANGKPFRRTARGFEHVAGRHPDFSPGSPDIAPTIDAVHDLHPRNILIDTRVRVFDWAWARRGAPWVDDAFLTARLMIAGHTPDQAERLTNPVPDEFVGLLHQVWRLLAEKDPKPHRRRLAAVARRWAEHRVA